MHTLCRGNISQVQRGYMRIFMGQIGNSKFSDFAYFFYIFLIFTLASKSKTFLFYIFLFIYIIVIHYNKKINILPKQWHMQIICISFLDLCQNIFWHMTKNFFCHFIIRDGGSSVLRNV